MVAWAASHRDGGGDERTFFFFPFFPFFLGGMVPASPSYSHVTNRRCAAHTAPAAAVGCGSRSGGQRTLALETRRGQIVFEPSIHIFRASTFQRTLSMVCLRMFIPDGSN